MKLPPDPLMLPRSPFANPFTTKRYSRDEAIRLYREYLLTTPGLPPATNAARTEDEPEYWQLVHDRLSVSGRRPGVVLPAAKGRHARMENSGAGTSVTTDAEHGYDVRVEVRSPQEQLVRAA